MQHAWAEIEHDLGYKSAAGVPRDIRRRFSRIAGLLELADAEFAAIRNQLSTYAATVSHEIRDRPEVVGLDRISLAALLSTRSSIRHLSTIIAEQAGASLVPSQEHELEHCAETLQHIKVNTVQELEHLAAAYLGVSAPFARKWLNGRRYATMHDGVGILYLAYIMLAARRDEAALMQYLDSARLSFPTNQTDAVHRLIQTYHEARAEADGGSA